MWRMIKQPSQWAIKRKTYFLRKKTEKILVMQISCICTGSQGEPLGALIE